MVYFIIILSVRCDGKKRNITEIATYLRSALCSNLNGFYFFNNVKQYGAGAVFTLDTCEACNGKVITNKGAGQIYQSYITVRNHSKGI